MTESLQLDYTAMLTFDDVRLGAQMSIPQLTENKAAVIQAIHHYSGLIEDEVHRPLMVRKYRESIDFRHLERAYVNGVESHVWYPKQYPVVQVEDGSANYTTDPDDVRRVVLPYGWVSAAPVTYFAGYRRSDQDLDILSAAPDPDDPDVTPLALLTTLPKVLPRNVQAVCLELVLARLFKASNKQYGTGTTRRQVGGGTVGGVVVGGHMTTVQAVDPTFEKETLKRLHVYKRY